MSSSNSNITTNDMILDEIANTLLNIIGNDVLENNQPRRAAAADTIPPIPLPRPTSSFLHHENEEVPPPSSPPSSPLSLWEQLLHSRQRSTQPHDSVLLGEWMSHYNKNFKIYQKNMFFLLEKLNSPPPLSFATTTRTSARPLPSHRRRQNNENNENEEEQEEEKEEEFENEEPINYENYRQRIIQQQQQPSPAPPPSQPPSSSTRRNNNATNSQLLPVTLDLTYDIFRYPYTQNHNQRFLILSSPRNESSAETTPTLLTNEQIILATESVIYTNDLQTRTNTTVCPISLENFVIGETLIKIKHCNHIFKTTQLLLWFRSHNDCPVCRHDLRQTTTSVPAATAAGMQ